MSREEETKRRDQLVAGVLIVVGVLCTVVVVPGLRHALLDWLR